MIAKVSSEEEKRWCVGVPSKVEGELLTLTVKIPC